MSLYDISVFAKMGLMMKHLTNDPKKLSDRETNLPDEFAKSEGYFPMTNLRIEELLETQKLLAAEMYNDEFWENIEKDPTIVIKR